MYLEEYVILDPTFVCFLNHEQPKRSDSHNSKTSPQGVGRRYAHVVLRKADIDLTKRAGELTEDEVRTGIGAGPGPGPAWRWGLSGPDPCPACQVERVITIMQNPRQYKIPDWFLNRQKDVKDGKYSQVCVERGEQKEKQAVQLGLDLGDQGGEQPSLTVPRLCRSWPTV